MTAKRRIGSNGPEVSAIGLGCMGMSFAYGQRDDEGSAATLRRALDIGVTHFDTADMYGFGHNEELIGRTIGDRRDEYVLATKFANRGELDAQGNLVRRWVDSSPQWAREALEDSLRRLRTDRIDLYYMHRRSPDVPIEDTVAAMADFVKQGKVRFIGLSEVSPATLRAAHAVFPITAVQMEYSLFTRFVEDEMLATCRELGVGLVAYSPVGRGWLTGKITSPADLAADDFRRTVPRFAEENFAHNMALVQAVREVADELGATPAQAALAWLLAQGDDVLPIPGTKRVPYLEENTAAADLVLTPDQLHRLTQAVPPGAVAGERYAPAGMSTVNQ
ncbi:aldo/keto reductase [Catellatospora coxensis]|uniref:Oxidoreductase n=1 Tax=Catellatospora coxensis TaxID=310354 RepID=A0A8J3PBU3_9ACTN|nr:aldo/keto reductase [Catellatospora coxensis]GIG10954.1 oxidoreductase [Catellatospora coxensis]